MARVQLRRLWQEATRNPGTLFIDRSPAFETPESHPSWLTYPVASDQVGTVIHQGTGQYLTVNLTSSTAVRKPGGDCRGVRMDLLSNPEGVLLATRRGGNTSNPVLFGADRAVATTRCFGSTSNQQGIYLVLESTRNAGATLATTHNARLVIVDADDQVTLDTSLGTATGNGNVITNLTASFAYTADGRISLTTQLGSASARLRTVTLPSGRLFEAWTETGPYAAAEALKPVAEWGLYEADSDAPVIGTDAMAKRRMTQRGDSRFGPGGKTRYNSMRRGPGVVF